MSKIRIGQTPEGKAVQLNLEILAETHAFLNATSGGGKSSLMRVIAERAAKHTQIIVLDWEGEYSTLREKIDLLIVGNLEGADLAVDPRAAKLLARRLLETNVSAVVDLSELEGDARNAYAAQFLMAMIDSPRALWHPVLVFVDELQELAPQAGGFKADSPMAQSLNALKAMAARGRKRGFGLIAATQRITKVHKDVISTLKNQLTGQTVLDVDRDRAADNLGLNKQGSLGLRDLNPGDWLAFGPALNLKGVNLFHADQGETTHLGAGQRHTLVIPAPTDAIRKSLSQFQDLPAEVQREADELGQARSEVRRLRQELAQRPVQVKPQIEVRERVIEKPVLNGELGRLEEIMREMSETGNRLTAFGGQLVTMGNQVVAVGGQVVSAARDVSTAITRFSQQAVPRPVPVSPKAISQPRPLASRPAPNSASAESLAAMVVGERKILTAVAQYPDGATREQLTVLTGYKRSSRDTYIQRLSARGFVTVSGQSVTATAEGIAALGADFEPLPTGGKLREYWLNRLTGGEKAILEVAVQYYPNAVDREAVSEATGYKRSSRDTYIQRLLARKLITTERSTIRASDELF